MDPLEQKIRTIPDFPEPGITFKDITPLLADGTAFHETIERFRRRYASQSVDVVVGIEARGFIFASALAYALGTGTCMIRKPGKLPYAVYSASYELEYGSDAVEIHTDAFAPGQRILLMDDVLATGGTVAAAAQLVQTHFDVKIIELSFLIELTFLQGRKRLGDIPVHSLMEYN